MAIALPTLAAETIFTPKNREVVPLSGNNAQRFVLNAQELYAATATSNRGLIADAEKAISFTQWIFMHANERYFDNAKPAQLDAEHRDGLYTWSKWLLSQATLRDELRMVRPDLRHEHIAIMARRDILAQRSQQLSGYLSMAEDYDYGYASLANIMDEQQVAGYGFADYAELAGFASEFKAITSSIEYRYIFSAPIKSGMEKAHEPGKAIRTALLSFFYINRLFPPDARDDQGRNARSVALRRLGLPQDTQYLEVSNREDRSLLQGFAVGKQFSHLNSTYVRGRGLKDVVYSRSLALN